jgi:hypothetical protein
MVKGLELQLLTPPVLRWVMLLLSTQEDLKLLTLLPVKAACILVTVLARPTLPPRKTNRVDFQFLHLDLLTLDFQCLHHPVKEGFQVGCLLHNWHLALTIIVICH